MKSLRSWCTGVALIAGLAATAQVSASVVILGTRVIFDGAKKETTVQIRNGSEVPAAGNEKPAPALVQSWIDDGDESSTPDAVKVPFTLTPPMTRIEPGKGQSLRVLYTPRQEVALPLDRESVFYLNVLEIPPKPKNAEGKNLLQLAVRTRIKLFYRPPGLPGDSAGAAAAMTWRQLSENGKRYLEATNPTPYYVSLTTVTVGDQKLEVDMVAPKASRRFELPNGTSVAGKPISLNWLDDYGASREHNATVAP